MIIWAIRKYFPNAQNFLEIGCGTGFVLSGIRESFPSMNLCGSEFYTNGLAIARQRLKDINFLQMDARQIPYKEEFDLIGAFDVLEHIEEDQLILQQMRKAVRTPYGGIILTVPQHEFLWSSIDVYSRHVRRYGACDLRRKIERAGFKVSYITSFVALLLPLMLVARLRRNAANQPFDPFAEFRLPGTLNRVLEGLMDFEQFFIRMGISFSAGGSLLVIARAV